MGGRRGGRTGAAQGRSREVHPREEGRSEMGREGGGVRVRGWAGVRGGWVWRRVWLLVPGLVVAGEGWCMVGGLADGGRCSRT